MARTKAASPASPCEEPRRPRDSVVCPRPIATPPPGQLAPIPRTRPHSQPSPHSQLKLTLCPRFPDLNLERVLRRAVHLLERLPARLALLLRTRRLVLRVGDGSAAAVARVGHVGVRRGGRGEGRRWERVERRRRRERRAHKRRVARGWRDRARHAGETGVRVRRGGGRESRREDRPCPSTGSREFPLGACGGHLLLWSLVGK